MKLVLIAAVSLLASCKGSTREPPRAESASASRSPGPSPSAAPSPGQSWGVPGAGAGSGAAGGASKADICKISQEAVDQATCTTPEGRQSLVDAQQAIGRIVETIGKVGGTSLRQYQVMCAQLLLAIERDAAKLSCTLALDARQRTEIAALLDAWYGQRTPVVPTGDAAADAVIARIGAVRDAACECRDAACLDRVDQQLVAIGALPATAPDAARTLGSKLLEDAARCAARVRALGEPPR
jgi:hypothetical protein